MLVFDGGKRIILAIGLAGAFLLASLMGLGAAQTVADSRTATGSQTNYVGLNGASCAYHDVADALAVASDGDTIYVSDVSSLTHRGLIGRIDHDLTFVAATNDCQTKSTTEAYLDGDGSSYALSGGLAVIGSTKTVTFSHIRLQNAHAANQGGIIYVEQDAKLVLDRSYILDGEAGNHGGGVYVAYGGSLLMSDSVVDTNEVTQTGIFNAGGGGVYVYYGAMTVTNNSYVGRVISLGGNVSAEDGGGIYLVASSLDIEDSWVLNNLAVGGGGGIMAIDGSTVKLGGDAIIGADTVQDPASTNYAGEGGGVYLDAGSALAMDDRSRVMWNSAVDNGGGIYAADGSYVAMRNDARVYSNTATFGGGVYLTGTGTDLDMFGSGVGIEGNRAVAPIGPGNVANGGGILATREAVAYIQGGHVISNDADLLGGGIYVAQDGASDSTVVQLVDGARLSGNVAGYGGGMYIGQDGSYVSVDDSMIRSNYAITRGGGIRLGGDSTLILRDNSVISGNQTLNDHGGGLAMDDGRVWILDSLFQANQAGLVTPVGSNGGAIRQSGGLLTITNSSLVGNYAYSGGGLSVFGASAVLTNVRVISNYGSQNGGGIALVYSDLRMGASFGADCTPAALPAHTYCSEVRGNGSPGTGAGVYLGVGQSTATIADTAFLDNQGLTPGASDGEALLVGNGATVSATNCLFTGHGPDANSAVHVVINAAYRSDNSTYAGNQNVPLLVDSQGAVTLTLNIIWDNLAWSDIQGSVSSRCNDTQTSLGGSGDISADPRFINLRGPYRLGPGSPAIDSCIGLTDHDLDGKSRPVSVGSGLSLFTYDMGAFEARPSVFVPAILRNL